MCVCVCVCECVCVRVRVRVRARACGLAIMGFHWPLWVFIDTCGFLLTVMCFQRQFLFFDR